MTALQKSRRGQIDPDEARALLIAARAFLLGEWAGALLMVASFSQLYWFTFARPGTPVAWTVGGGIALLALGAWVFASNRTYFRRLEVEWGRRSEFAATVTAGAGVIFWLLFLVLLVLAWAGQPLLPD